MITAWPCPGGSLSATDEKHQLHTSPACTHAAYPLHTRSCTETNLNVITEMICAISLQIKSFIHLAQLFYLFTTDREIAAYISATDALSDSAPYLLHWWWRAVFQARVTLRAMKVQFAETYRQPAAPATARDSRPYPQLYGRFHSSLPAASSDSIQLPSR